MMKISIIGSVGVPACYGGFESLAENLVRFNQENGQLYDLVVYCSASRYQNKHEFFLGAKLKYINLNANGISSIFYDIFSLFLAIKDKSDAILMLGVSGALVLPFVRLLSPVRIITNIDGLEWKRQKWSALARWLLRFSEAVAVFSSHVVVADNAGIAKYVEKIYGRSCNVIAYGGDHATSHVAKSYTGVLLPRQYALALCRIEPENNVTMILEAFSLQNKLNLVFIGNWQDNVFSRDLFKRFQSFPNIHLINPIYDLGILRALRSNAILYIHGHSAGGTNPSLVEMMHFGITIFAYDCIYNRYTTDSKAIFFKDTGELQKLAQDFYLEDWGRIGVDLKNIALRKYRWEVIGREYFKIMFSKK